jgi:outer membrane biosynthesis protein TonB
VSSDDLDKSLREEVEAYISRRLGSMQEEIFRLQSELNESFTRLVERSTGESMSDTSVASTIAEHLRAAHERGVEQAAAESSKAKASSDLAIIKAAVEEIHEQHSQAEILNTLVNRSSSFAPRVAFFIVRNDNAIGWRARGLEGSVGDEAVREISLALSAETVLGDVAHSRTSWSGTPGSKSENHLLLNRLGGDPPERIVAVPLVVREKTVAILYADSAALDSDALNLEALETLVRVASMAVELLSTARAPAKAPGRGEAAPADVRQEAPAEEEREPAPELAPQEYTPHIEPEAEPVVEPEPEPVATPVAEEAAAPEFERVTDEPAPPAETVAEAPAEPQAATPPSSAASSQYAAPLGTARRWGGSDADLPIEVNEDERRLHNDARRFARLLVSEIKLYNEQKVKEGRSDGNIYDRLREDIDRSRQMYDKRVAPPVAARYDYFHQELVNTLAEGDSGKLGSSYPGEMVSA